MLYRLIIPTIMACSVGTATAQDLTVRGPHSGLWFNPDQPGHGIDVDVINTRQAVVSWYAYNDDGQPYWLLGTGNIDGPTIDIFFRSYRGGSFPPGFDASEVVGQAWGSATLNFQSCSEAQLNWTPEQTGFEQGSLTLRRLSAVDGLSCGAEETFHQVSQFNFDAGAGNWTPLFADYGTPQADTIETVGRWEQLPEPLASRDGFRLGGTNTPDSLAMFLTTPLGGLQPDTSYALEIEMRFATTVPQDCVGIGGSPGSSVYVKLGEANVAPEVIREEDDFRFNIDKGNQSQGGEDAVVVGDMTNFQENCTDDAQWQLKTVSTAGTDFRARTDDAGTLWVYAGTDSGFEGRTVYFITDFVVRLSPMESSENR